MPWELNWYHHAKDQRIAAMREAKTVLCSCIACKNNWPILDNVPDFKVTHNVIITYVRFGIDVYFQFRPFS